MKNPKSEIRSSKSGIGPPLVAFWLLTLACSLPAWAQYSIDWSTVDGGGGTSTGGVYSVSGTIGQADAGQTMAGGAYTLTGGFWPIIAVQSPVTPLLTIVPAGPGLARISWQPGTTGWVLQETLGLSPPNWVNSVSGSANPVIVPATGGMKLYRLHRP